MEGTHLIVLGQAFMRDSMVCNPNIYIYTNMFIPYVSVLFCSFSTYSVAKQVRTVFRGNLYCVLTSCVFPGEGGGHIHNY